VRLSLKELTIVAALGSLWGSVEIGLGSFLHVWNVPFSGATLAAIGMAVALVARLVGPRRGSTLALAIIAALLKALSIGGVVLSPMIAIILEGAIAELALTIGGRPRRLLFVITGALAVGWTLVHPLVVQGLLFGAGIISMYRLLIQRGASLLHLSTSSVVAVLVALLVVHLLVGAVAGLVAWQAGCSVLARRAAGEPDEGAPA
jgi:hypothetical protein